MKKKGLDLGLMTDNYRQKYSCYGYSPKSLGWDKGKQDIRFRILTSRYDFTNKAILDIGCGFGDLNRALSSYQNYAYLGIDIVEDFIDEAKRLYAAPDIHFTLGNFLKYPFDSMFDYAIASGTFNFRLDKVDNYEFVEQTIEKTLQIVRDGLAFDFLSNKVDWELGHAFHFDPAKILTMAYRFSRNVVLLNDYMPFEFALFILKDDSFTTHDTVFTRYKKEHGGL